MSYDLNNVSIMGRLTRDPELRNTQNGKQVCNFSIASNHGKRNDQDVVGFFDITCFERTAESCSQYLKKGSQVAIAGRLVQDRYTGKDGQNKTKVGITANNVYFIGGKTEQQPVDENAFNS